MPTKRAARRGFLSGVALIALIAGAALAFGRLQQRVAPVRLPAAQPAVAMKSRNTPAQIAPRPQIEPRTFVRVVENPARVMAPAPRTPPPKPSTLAADEPRWVRVMTAPERRYERTIPPVYGTIEERVLLEPERDVVETVPARYGVRTRRVLLEPARTVVDVVPATWEWRDRAGGMAKPAAWEGGRG
jgi:hypothetical protein